MQHIFKPVSTEIWNIHTTPRLAIVIDSTAQTWESRKDEKPSFSCHQSWGAATKQISKALSELSYQKPQHYQSKLIAVKWRWNTMKTLVLHIRYSCSWLVRLEDQEKISAEWLKSHSSCLKKNDNLVASSRVAATLLIWWCYWSFQF